MELELQFHQTINSRVLDQLIVLRKCYKDLYNKIKEFSQLAADQMFIQYQALAKECSLLHGKAKN